MFIFSSGFCLHLYLLLSYFFRICERESLGLKGQKVRVSSFDDNSIFFFCWSSYPLLFAFSSSIQRSWMIALYISLTFLNYTIFLINWQNSYILAWHEWLVFSSIGLYGCLMDIFVICGFLCMWFFTTKYERSIWESLEARVEWFV